MIFLFKVGFFEILKNKFKNLHHQLIAFHFSFHFGILVVFPGKILAEILGLKKFYEVF